MGIRIVVDSTSDLTDEIIEKYNIKMVPLTVNFENESFLDKVELSTKEFFEKLEVAENFPPPPWCHRAPLWKYSAKS